MSISAINTRIKHKIDTLANWQSENAVTLLSGELAIVILSSGDIRMKIGDGTSSFDALPYLGNEQISAMVKIVDNKLPNYYTKTQVNNISSAISGSTDTFIDGTKNNLSVMRIAESAYRDLVKAGTALSNVLYITSSDVEDMYGERIVNVGTPVDANDAATKAYVDEKIGDIDAILKEIIG